MHVHAGGCSRLLERRITDFAAEVPFALVPAKLKEHYGIEVCSEKLRGVTLKHANRADDFLPVDGVLPEVGGVRALIAEADGCMVPIVEFTKEAEENDKRRRRAVCWKEARLCLSRASTKVNPHFRATMGSTDTLGDLWYQTALEAGLGAETEVFAIGDGALWVQDQAQRVFGAKGSFLLDFFHVCEYLAEAAPHCAPGSPDTWRKEQQERLKRGDLYLVLQDLERALYETGAEEKPVRSCYQYLSKRLNQLDYLGHLQDDLPIGSGEIESAHRYVIQSRRKRPGAWWKAENAQQMLQLLTLRANNLWDCFWGKSEGESLKEAI